MVFGPIIKGVSKGLPSLKLIQGGKKDIVKTGLSTLGEEVPEQSLREVRGLMEGLSQPANLNTPTEQTKFTASRIFDPKQSSQRGDHIQIELLQNAKPPLSQYIANDISDFGYQLKTVGSPLMDKNMMPIEGASESHIWLTKFNKKIGREKDEIGMWPTFSAEGKPATEVYFPNVRNIKNIKQFEMRLARKRAEGRSIDNYTFSAGKTKEFNSDLNNPEDLDNLMFHVVNLNEKFIKENKKISKIFQEYKKMSKESAKRRLRKIYKELTEEDQYEMRHDMRSWID
mgnify:CR=1 FL=1